MPRRHTSGWELVGFDVDPTPGEPESIRAVSTTYAGIAERAEQAYQLLRGEQIRDGAGEAMRELNARVGELPGKLRRTYESFQRVATAYGRYATTLEDAQGLLDQAIDRAQAVHATATQEPPDPPAADASAAEIDAFGRRTAQIDSARSELNAAQQLAVDARALREDGSGSGWGSRQVERELDTAAAEAIPERGLLEKGLDFLDDVGEAIDAFFKNHPWVETVLQIAVGILTVALPVLGLILGAVLLLVQAWRMAATGNWDITALAISVLALASGGIIRLAGLAGRLGPVASLLSAASARTGTMRAAVTSATASLRAGGRAVSTKVRAGVRHMFGGKADAVLRAGKEGLTEASAEAAFDVGSKLAIGQDINARDVLVSAGMEALTGAGGRGIVDGVGRGDTPDNGGADGSGAGDDREAGHSHGANDDARAQADGGFDVGPTATDGSTDDRTASHAADGLNGAASDSMSPSGDAPSPADTTRAHAGPGARDGIPDPAAGGLERQSAQEPPAAAAPPVRSVPAASIFGGSESSPPGPSLTETQGSGPDGLRERGTELDNARGAGPSSLAAADLSHPSGVETGDTFAGPDQQSAFAGACTGPVNERSGNYRGIAAELPGPASRPAGLSEISPTPVAGPFAAEAPAMPAAMLPDATDSVLVEGHAQHEAKSPRSEAVEVAPEGPYQGPRGNSMAEQASSNTPNDVDQRELMPASAGSATAVGGIRANIGSSPLSGGSTSSGAPGRGRSSDAGQSGRPDGGSRNGASTSGPMARADGNALAASAVGGGSTPPVPPGSANATDGDLPDEGSFDPNSAGPEGLVGPGTPSAISNPAFGTHRDAVSGRDGQSPSLEADAPNPPTGSDLQEAPPRDSNPAESDAPILESPGSPPLPETHGRGADPDSTTGDQDVDRRAPVDPKFDELKKENTEIRNRKGTGDANRKARNKWPERTISTGAATGTVDGKPFHEKIAVISGEERFLKGTGGEHLPILPPEGRRIFKTYSFEGTPRAVDSEPKAFEKLARDILKAGSGRSVQAIESAIESAIEKFPRTQGYPVDAKDVIEEAATRIGVDLDAVEIDVEMVIDFPRGAREGKTPAMQICGSCYDLIDDFERAFGDKITVRARNLAGETMRG